MPKISLFTHPPTQEKKVAEAKKKRRSRRKSKNRVQNR